MGPHHTIKCGLQLFVNSYGGEDDFMAGRRVFGGVAIESCVKVFKPVAELNNITVISELCDI